MSVASAACFSSDSFWAVSCSISWRTVVSCACTSRMSGIFVALAMIAWRAVSVARRLTRRAPRSTTWLVTSSLAVCSASTFVPTARSAARVASQRSAGTRKVTVALADSPSPWRCEAATYPPAATTAFSAAATASSRTATSRVSWPVRTMSGPSTPASAEALRLASSAAWPSTSAGPAVAAGRGSAPAPFSTGAPTLESTAAPPHAATTTATVARAARRANEERMVRGIVAADERRRVIGRPLWRTRCGLGPRHGPQTALRE